VTYTVWLGDRLIGETDLANERVEPRYRSGNFFPVPGNEMLFPTTDSSLQVRDPTGRVIPTDWVNVYDLEANPIDDDDLGFDEQLDDELEASIEHDAVLIREWIDAREVESFDDAEDEPWIDEFSRYQIQLKLAKGAALP